MNNCGVIQYILKLSTHVLACKTLKLNRQLPFGLIHLVSVLILNTSCVGELNTE